MLLDLPIDRAACFSPTATLNNAKFCESPMWSWSRTPFRSLTGEAGLEAMLISAEARDRGKDERIVRLKSWLRLSRRQLLTSA